MAELNFFFSTEYLEPRCPKCKTVLDYGINTTFNEEHKTHVCNNCGEILK